MKQHPLSAAFPSIDPDELKSLAADIKANGLRSAITTFKGDVLDGWHRFRACGMAGVNPRFIEYKGTDPVAFVRSANWHRRHLSASQRAMVEVSLSEWSESGRPKTVPQENQQAASEESGKTVLNSTVSKSKEQMAEAAGVGTNTIALARAVKTNGVEALQTAVKEDKISVSRAAEIAKLPQEEQTAAMAAKPAPKEKPVQETDGDGGLLKELEAADQTIRSQQALIASLQSGDLANEIAAWSLKYDQLNGRLQSELTTCAEAKKQAKYYGDLLSKIRKALKVTTNAQILEALPK